jgi:hypothetical protein
MGARYQLFNIVHQPDQSPSNQLVDRPAGRGQAYTNARTARNGRPARDKPKDIRTILVFKDAGRRGSTPPLAGLLLG